MRATIHLLGHPRVVRDGAPVPPARGHKQWAVLAYLVSAGTPVTRQTLCDLLFADADDPLAALRWSLSALRQLLGTPDLLRGDPLVLALPPQVVVDVWQLEAGQLPPVETLHGGAELLGSLHFPSAPRFEVWLENRRRQLAGLMTGLLHEAAQAHLAVGRAGRAVELAALLVQLEPLDEGHHALLVRALASDGQGVAAAKRVAACRELFRRELGVDPGARLEAAAQVTTARPVAAARAGRAAVLAEIEAGTAAVDGGVVDAGIQCLRRAVVEAGELGEVALEVRALVALGSALVHGVRGHDDEGATALTRALALGAPLGEESPVAARELGYVEYLRGRDDREEPWLTRAARAAGRDRGELARIATVRGSALTDVGRYEAALESLDIAVDDAPDDRSRSYAESMRGRVHLLRRDLDAAETSLVLASELALHAAWTAFVPWPDSMLAEVELARGHVDAAERRVNRAFHHSCRIGDPCWEGMSGRGRALVLAAQGEPGSALEALDDARVRTSRLPDSYLWVEARLLETICHVASAVDEERARRAADTLVEVAARSGMRELLVRGLLHQAALGRPASADLAREIERDLEVEVSAAG